MKPSFLILCLSCLALLLLACAKNPQATESIAQKVFTVKGVVVRVEDEGRTMIIRHEEIPDYMGAMTMPFRVKEPSESRKVHPGDEILFIYKVAELSSWIEAIKPTGNTEEIKADTTKPTPSSKLLKVGERFPDIELLNEQGDAVNLSDYRGLAVALTFIFTRCPVPEYCPAMMRNFSEVETLLKADANAPTNYKLLTLSFDSDFDTPEVMKAYGEKFGQSTGNWNMLTSPKTETVKSLGESVGLMFGKSEGSIYSHNLRTVVLNGDGRITKIFTDESWKPEELVVELKKATKHSRSE